MPLATRRDYLGRPIFGDPTAGDRPDNPLYQVDETSDFTKQVAANRNPANATVGMPTERQSSVDYSGFGNRMGNIKAQGTDATARAQAAAYQAMQNRLSAISGETNKLSQGMRLNGPVDTTDLRSRLVNQVAAEKGVKYTWGGTSPKTGFDCSGLVQWAYKRLGINMPRTSGPQAQQGVRMPINKLRPGDLVAHPGHIAVYAGNGYMWEAPHTGAAVRLVPVRSNMYGVHLTLPGD
jgi:cell wall-associated NlpC family hydrolase